MRDAVPPCGMRRRGEAGRRTRTPSQQPSGRGGLVRADRHHNLHAPRLQNHPRITFRRSGSIRAFVADLDKQRRCGPRDGQHGSRRRPPGRPRRRDVHFALESAVPTVILECKVHPSSAKRTSRRGRGRSAGRLTRGPAGYRIPDTAFRTPHSGRRIPDAAFRTPRLVLDGPTDASRAGPHAVGTQPGPDAARRSDGMSPPMPDRTGFITLTG